MWHLSMLYTLNECGKKIFYYIRTLTVIANILTLTKLRYLIKNTVRLNVVCRPLGVAHLSSV